MDNKTLLKLKEKYWSIYKSEINGITFIWRELSRKEFNRVTRLFADPYDREEEVCRICVIEPVSFDFENCPAGIPTTLCNHILIESGFGPPTGKLDRVLTQFREEMQDFRNQVSCIIHEAFPTLDIEEIEDWSFEKTLWYFSRAEYKLSLRGIQLVNRQEENGVQQNNIQDINGINISGDLSDFPELKAQKEFMEGKWRKNRR